VFWVGFAIFNIGFLQPAVKATGAEGLKVMQYLSGKTRLMPSIYAAATLTMLSGLILYWPMAGSDAFMKTGYGLSCLESDAVSDDVIICEDLSEVVHILLD